jgi:hypothetical protein
VLWIRIHIRIRIRIILVTWIRIRINKNPDPHSDPHHSDQLDPDPHQFADTSQNVWNWNISLFEFLFGS